MTPIGVSVITAVADLQRYQDDWDALAVASARPLSAPGWLLSWWEAMAPSSAQPRVVIVTDGSKVIGIAPFYALRRRHSTEYWLFGSRMANRNAPLALHGREREVAAGIAFALAGSRPRPSVVHLDQIDHGSPWPRLLADAWPRPGAWVTTDVPVAAPTLSIADGDPEDWLTSKSAHFRKRFRQSGRKLEAAGASVRVTNDLTQLERAMCAFRRLHGERWGDTSELSTPAGRELMLAAGRTLMPTGRFRAAMVEVDDEVISVDFLLAAGGEVACWNGGWDESWARHSPAIHGLVGAIHDAMGRGECRVDFGEGAHQYKLRLADGDAPVAWVSLYPRTPRGALARLAASGQHIRGFVREAVNRLPPGARDAAYRWRRRLSPAATSPGPRP